MPSNTENDASTVIVYNSQTYVFVGMNMLESITELSKHLNECKDTLNKSLMISPVDILFKKDMNIYYSPDESLDISLVSNSEDD
jgi:hypothetical protein